MLQTTRNKRKNALNKQRNKKDFSESCLCFAFICSCCAIFALFLCYYVDWVICGTGGAGIFGARGAAVRNHGVVIIVNSSSDDVIAVVIICCIILLSNTSVLFVFVVRVVTVFLC